MKKKGLGKVNRLLLIISVPVMIFIFVLIYNVNVPNQVTVEGEIIRITGMYGTSVSREAITSIELLDDIPKVERRIKGFKFGDVYKGVFRLEEWNYGHGWLYLQSNNGPYISIRYNVEGFILINYKNPEETIKVYEIISTS